jgi:hypothetical protein
LIFELILFTSIINIAALSAATLPSTKIISTLPSNSFTLSEHSSALYAL